ncbi:uncharacterized protein K452DRAFT_283436 [Aplosporella prunicola CBS 121167]|uniref:Uncharacterized protein n=1 Tax=Aplosporella prunicola CBS 121167 TaxID=1176127 RepID=A0A6A6BS83_9PEZI|nr:uncharacterized protein K452DRAFT_283436 [Aplosporella prunicola CBS 121167]KAF2146145.1 hypothetical protein K452DRAFT_283436 [Aplosporella prunicola CBS 121167]
MRIAINGAIAVWFRCAVVVGMGLGAHAYACAEVYGWRGLMMRGIDSGERKVRVWPVSQPPRRKESRVDRLDSLPIRPLPRTSPLTHTLFFRPSTFTPLTPWPLFSPPPLPYLFVSPTLTPPPSHSSHCPLRAIPCAFDRVARNGQDQNRWYHNREDDGGGFGDGDAHFWLIVSLRMS